MLVYALKVFFFSQAVLSHSNSNDERAWCIDEKSMNHNNIQFAATAPSDRLLSPDEL